MCKEGCQQWQVSVLMVFFRWHVWRRFTCGRRCCCWHTEQLCSWISCEVPCSCCCRNLWTRHCQWVLLIVLFELFESYKCLLFCGNTSQNTVRLVLHIKFYSFPELFCFFCVVLLFQITFVSVFSFVLNLHGHVGVFISYHCPAVEVSHSNRGNVLSAVTML